MPSKTLPPTPGVALDEEELTTRVAKPIVGIRPRPRRAHVLELSKGKGIAPRVELKGERLVIGRAENVDIVVESEEVSRQHARFVRLDDEYQIEDLDSRNGVYLNGLKVHLATLREGDELQLGDLVFLYREGS
jgi:pSer/pThr/pTyr-binding forkhead associated (FHA) protein